MSKFIEYVKKNGARKAAMKLVSDSIYIHCGITASELPDNEKICSMYDEIEQLIIQYSNGADNKKEILSVLNQIDYDFVNDLIYS